MKALVGAFNQEALVGAFSMIVKTDGSFAALHSTDPLYLNVETFINPLSSPANIDSLMVIF